MGVSVKTGRFSTRSGTGTQDITDVGFQPKALIIFGNPTGAYDTFSEVVICDYGISDGTNHASVCFSSVDNSTTSDTYSNVSNSTILNTFNESGTEVYRVTVSFLSNGFQLNYAVNTAANLIYGYIAIGGTDITNVKVGTQSIGTTTTGNKAYTGVGFQPDFLIAASTNFLPTASAYTFNNTAEANAGLVLSAMKSSSERWTVSVASEDARTTSDTWKYQRGDKCFAYLDNTTGGLLAEADFVSFDSDGFTWNYTTNTTSNNQNGPFIYLAIKGGVWDVSHFQSPTTNTTVQTNTSSGATLKGVQFANVTSTLITSTTISAHNHLDMGASDGTTPYGSTIHDTDAAGNMINVRVISNTYVIKHITAAATATSSTIQGRATVSLSTSSFTTTWTSTDGTQRYIPYWALSESSSTLFTRSITESSISVSDSVARLLTANRSLSESSISVSDSNTRTFYAFRTLSEPSITVSDAVERVRIVPRAINEPSISVSDALVRQLLATRAINESSISVSESLARILYAFRTISEPSISVSDAVTGNLLFIRSINEAAISVSDSVARLLIATRVLSESSISVSDSLARTLSAFRTINEASITVSDAVVRSLIATRAINEPSISVSDSVARLLLAVRVLAEPSITVSDSLVRTLVFPRLLSEPSISVSDAVAGILIGSTVQIRTITEPSITVLDKILGKGIYPNLAQYIVDPGYSNPIQFMIIFKSRKNDDAADPSGDQIIYYKYDSFIAGMNPSLRPFNITAMSLRLMQGEIGGAELIIEDSKGNITDTRKISFKSEVEVYFKKELGLEWEKMLTGYVRRFRIMRPRPKTLSYKITVVSKQVVYNERIVNYKRAAKRTAIDSTIPLTTDSKMLANNLFRELHTAKDILPLRKPTLKDQANFNLDTGSISDDVTDFIAEIGSGLTTASEVANYITEVTGAIWGVDADGNPFLRYPTEKHSGIILTDSPQNTDSALNTSINMDSFEYEDTIDTVEGFGNKLYVLNSKDTKSTASSSIASGGFTSLTTRWISQSFIAGDNNITGAAFILSKVGNPQNEAGSIKGVLRGNSGSQNFPTGPTLASFEISLSELENSPKVIFVNDIKTPAGSIIPNERYHWVLQGTGLFDDSNTVRWHHDGDQVTPNRFSARLPLVDTDPTKPGLQLNWIRSSVGPVYAFSTFSSVRHILTQSDPESIKELGLIESVVNLPAFDDDATFQKALLKILQYSAKIKRIYENARVTIPTQRLFRPGELVTLIDSKSKLTADKVVNAEVVEVTYNFDTTNNALGCKYVDLRLIAFIDPTTDYYLDNKEC